MKADEIVHYCQRYQIKVSHQSFKSFSLTFGENLTFKYIYLFCVSVNLLHFKTILPKEAVKRYHGDDEKNFIFLLDVGEHVSQQITFLFIIFELQWNLTDF